MSLVIKGMGAVSPAGWNVSSLLEASLAGTVTPISPLERTANDGTVVSTPVHRVPPTPSSPPWGKHSRMRRVSPISKFLVAAALEALGPERIRQCATGQLRVAILFCTVNGCVHYSNRFFAEVLANPATASPILFPETVFNAPASHLASFLESSAPTDTLLGDEAEFFAALQIAEEWLDEDAADGCLVVAAEELDWASSEAAQLYHRQTVSSEGAGALYVEKSGAGVVVSTPKVIPYLDISDRTHTAQLLLPNEVNTDCLVTSLRGIDRLDAAELACLQDTNCRRISPKIGLGDALAASTAFQCVVAASMVKNNLVKSATALTLGCSEQAALAHFTS